MTDFKTYRPSIQFTQEMLADYLYVLSFKGTTPSEIYLTTEREENKIPPNKCFSSGVFRDRI